MNKNLGEISWDDKNLVRQENNLTELANKANSVSIKTIISQYKKIFSNMITCPFPTHKKGKESTASFKIFEDKNTFYCFGCKTGKTPVDFVMKMENVSYYEAIQKILNSFTPKVILKEEDSFDEKAQLLLNFSKIIYEFKIKNTRLEDFLYIEGIAKVFDKLYTTHDLSNAALQRLLEELKSKIDEYTLCQNL